jgi:phage anti-repressor protein
MISTQSNNIVSDNNMIEPKFPVTSMIIKSRKTNKELVRFHARDIHEYCDTGYRYTEWFKLKSKGFGKEGVDYILESKLLNASEISEANKISNASEISEAPISNEKQNHLVSLEMAKWLVIHTNTEKAQQLTSMLIRADSYLKQKTPSTVSHNSNLLNRVAWIQSNLLNITQEHDKRLADLEDSTINSTRTMENILTYQDSLKDSISGLADNHVKYDKAVKMVAEKLDEVDSKVGTEIEKVEAKFNEQFTELYKKLNGIQTTIPNPAVEYFTVKGYCSLKGIKLSKGQAISAGTRASKLSANSPYPKKEIEDEEYGKIGVYHKSILKEVLGK